MLLRGALYYFLLVSSQLPQLSCAARIRSMIAACSGDRPISAVVDLRARPGTDEVRLTMPIPSTLLIICCTALSLLTRLVTMSSRQRERTIAWRLNTLDTRDSC